LLVDEESIVRAGLRILIDGWSGLHVVGEFDSVQQTLPDLETLAPDIIIFSHSSHCHTFLEDLREIAAAARTVPILVITDSRDAGLGAQALRAGARWIALKHHAPIELRRTIESVCNGELSLNRSSTAKKIAQMYRRDRQNGYWPDADYNLTDRELEVAVLVSQGCTNKQVGNRLGITEVTVRHHLTSIFSKLRIGNRFKLTVWLHQRGIVRSEQFGQFS